MEQARARTWLAVGISLFCFSEVQSEPYFGVSVGVSGLEGDTGFLFASYDSNEFAFKLIGGARPVSWFEIEGSYVDLGGATLTPPMFSDVGPDEEEVRALTAFGVFSKQTRFVNLFAKIGLVRWRLEGSSYNWFGRYDVSEEDTDLAWGVGIRRPLGQFLLRAEYERFDFVSGRGFFDRPDFASVGFVWALDNRR